MIQVPFALSVFGEVDGFFRNKRWPPCFFTYLPRATTGFSLSIPFCYRQEA